jgi:putative phosphonate transport system ATP-binding protein
MGCCGVSREVYPGDVLGVVGESGSGKSTLVRLIHFEYEATAGAGYLNYGPDAARENLLEASSFRRRQVRSRTMGIVYQNPTLGLRMQISSGGNIAEKLLAAGWRSVSKIRGRAADLLRRTEIPVERMDEPPANFSGGMQQRVQIAKALSNDPQVLLLDEVTTGLDLSVQARVLDLIRSLQRELAVAMIVVSHDLSVIRLLCQRTMVMRNGGSSSRDSRTSLRRPAAPLHATAGELAAVKIRGSGIGYSVSGNTKPVIASGARRSSFEDQCKDNDRRSPRLARLGSR